LSSPLLRGRLPSPKLASVLELGGNYPGAWLLRRGLFLPWELGTVLDRDVVQAGLRRLAPMKHVARALEPQPRSPFARVATLEASLYMRNQLLRDTDWAGMAHSIEIRTPLVDSRLLERIAPVTLAARGAA